MEKNVHRRELENKERRLKEEELDKVAGGKIESSNVVGYQPPQKSEDEIKQ